jgi:hypothetical protein
MGLAGVAHSLDMVATKAIEGGQDEVVRAWATHILQGCGWPKGARARAACALADTRLYPWIPDPVDVEFIPAPRLMMPNKLTGKPAVYLADDCDGLTARWMALCLAMGVRCQVVGYSFDAKTNLISHVLGSIWDDIAEEWVDGDPSFQDMPLGKTQPHVWEQRRDLPTMKITCDDIACDLKKAPDKMDSIVNFVGVGKPGPMPGARGASTLGVPTGVTEDKGGHQQSSPGEVPAQVGEEFLGLADDVDAHWGELKTNYDMMREGFAAQGLSTVEQLAPYGWSAEDQQSAIDVGVMAQLCSRYLREAVAGVRGIFGSEDNTPAMTGIAGVVQEECVKSGGKYTPATGGFEDCACPAGTTFDFGKGCIDAKGAVREQTWAIEAKPQDVLGIELDANGKPFLVNAKGIMVHAAPNNAIGAEPVSTTTVLIIAAVITVAVVYGVVTYMDILARKTRDINRTRLDSKMVECYEPGSGVPREECDRRVAAYREYRLREAAAEAKLHETEGDANPMTALTRLVNTALYAGGAILTVYGVVKLVSFVSANKKAST